MNKHNYISIKNQKKNIFKIKIIKNLLNQSQLKVDLTSIFVSV